MGLRTTAGHLLLALAPPANLARDLALYRQDLFRGGAGTSCLALPEVAVLGRLPDLEASREPLGHKAFWGRARRQLKEVLDDLEGSFQTLGTGEDQGWRVLELGPLFRDLRQSLEDKPTCLGHLEAYEALPIRGFALGRLDDPPGLEPPPAPRLSFRSASLVLLEFWLGEALQGVYWTEILRAQRSRQA